MTQLHDNIVGIDAAIFMHPLTWKASGHVDGFNDPMIDNKDSKSDIVPTNCSKVKRKNIPMPVNLKRLRHFWQKWGVAQCRKT